MEANQPEDELARMSYVNLKTETTLSDEEQVCRHYLVSALNQGSLMQWDSMGVTECEGYPLDPFTERTAENCPACGYYLYHFLTSCMRRCRWKPELHNYYCTGCRAVKELPAKGSNKVGLAKCTICRTKVIDALAAVWTYVATSLTTEIAEGQTPAQGEWTIHSGSNRRDTILWLQGVAENLTICWERKMLKDTDHLPELVWSTGLRTVTAEQIQSMRPKPISWPQELVDNQDEETFEDVLVDMETDVDDMDVVVEFEGEFGDVVDKVTFGDFENVTFGDKINVTSGNVGFGVEVNNNSYVKPFNVSEKSKQPAMANNQSKLAAEQAKLAEEMGSQQVPQPGQAPSSTPRQGAIARRQTVSTTGSTNTTKNSHPKKKDKASPVQNEMVSISQKTLTELLKLPEQVKKLQIRVTHAERSLKRKTSSSHPEDSAKKSKVGSSDLIVSLRNTPKFVNPAYFHNWWSKKGVIPTLTKRRMSGELSNMGLSEDSLIKLTLHILAEVYCLVVSLLLESGAIQRLPSDVPNCYGNSGLTQALKLEKLALIAPQICQQITTTSGFLSVDRRRAGAVQASILAHNAASHPPVNPRSDLRSRLDARSRKPVPPKITFGPPRSRGVMRVSTRTFTNSNRSGRAGIRDRTGSLPVRGLQTMNSSDPVPVVTIEEANPVVVSETVDIDMGEEDTNHVEVEELPEGFFHSTETFPDDVSEAPDRHTAGVSMTGMLPGNSQSGSSDVDERRPSSSSRRRTRTPSPGPSSGSRHSSVKRKSRSKKRESRRDHSREAERTIPGFTSSTTRKLSASTNIRSRLFSPDRKCYGSFPCSQRRRSTSSPRRSRRDSRGRRRDSRERRRDSRERHGRDHSRPRRTSRH